MKLPCIFWYLSKWNTHLFTQKIFIHYKKFDDFNHRSSHKTLATRTGGIGVFATLLLFLLIIILIKLSSLTIPYLSPWDHVYCRGV